MSGKRRRPTSLTSHEHPSETPPRSISPDVDTSAVQSKLPRASESTTRSLVCSLPPCCAPPRHPTTLASLRELEAHYAKYHTHTCQEGDCRREQGGAKIFPDARLLELHQTEYHDQLAALKNERGEKIFACFLESCPRKFRTPKGRRLHLISVHGYPKLYFFAVTKHGIGELLARYGEGATLIRKEWKPRPGGADDGKEPPNNDDSDDGSLHKSDHGTDQLDDPDVDSVSTKNAADALATESLVAPQPSQPADSLDDLTSSMKSLNLVPTSIRFGRGARRAGFVRGGAARGGISNVTSHTSSLRNREE